MYIFLPLAVFFLFSFASSVQLKDRPVYKHLRNIGMLIYFSHLLIAGFVAVGIKVLYKLWEIKLDTYWAVFTLPCTIAFAVLIDWLSGKEKFKWIKWCLS